jgi:hypothetical protein
VRFFVPFVEEAALAEAIWAAARDDLLAHGLPTTRRRIYALSLDDRRPDWLLHVGRETPRDDGPALLILEASDVDLYFVCTPTRGLLEGPPVPLALGEHGSVVDFDDDPIERLWGAYLR